MDSLRLKESVLIERIINGDNDAFRKMISKYQGLVSHIVYRMIDNSADREDLCQDIFAKAYKTEELSERVKTIHLDRQDRF